MAKNEGGRVAGGAAGYLFVVQTRVLKAAVSRCPGDRRQLGSAQLHWILLGSAAPRQQPSSVLLTTPVHFLQQLSGLPRAPRFPLGFDPYSKAAVGKQNDFIVSESK